ncbi:arylesterase [Mangrovimicrobium sediminis]|uniref:Arylesterase n=2 Tax=Mangrovimicrobium sediminis TaxID=2562682 RepID=A0A4Z0M6Q1_9GAMM|nr:arylesterase [Haliea sp. SAOS-164]
MPSAFSLLLRYTWLCGLCLCLLLASGARAAPTRLMVLGDSISAAYGMSLQQGWVSLLADELRDGDIAVINASISGETTDGALRRLPALLETHAPDLVIIELGGNDGLRGFPLATLRENLTQLVTQSQAAGAEVLLLPMHIPPNYGRRYTEAFHTSFAEVAQATGAGLGPFILDGIAGRPELMQGDGIHPQPEAQAQMLANVLPAIREALQ